MNNTGFLAECEAKAKEAKWISGLATPGPWHAGKWLGGRTIQMDGYNDAWRCIRAGRENEDAEFIAHARTSNPDLAARVLQLVAMVRERDEQIEDMRDRAREAAEARDR